MPKDCQEIAKNQKLIGNLLEHSQKGYSKSFKFLSKTYQKVHQNCRWEGSFKMFVAFRHAKFEECQKRTVFLNLGGPIHNWTIKLLTTGWSSGINFFSKIFQYYYHDQFKSMIFCHKQLHQNCTLRFEFGHDIFTGFKMPTL